MRLTKHQEEEFNKNGFIILRNFLDKKQSKNILNRAKIHIQKQEEPIETEEQYKNINTTTKTLRRLRQVYDRDDVFANWMTNKSITPILEQLLKDKVILTLAHHNSIMTKMPQKNTSTCWHQDIRYWNFTNDSLISIWLSLMDENIQNGVLWFIPGSHKMNLDNSRFDKDICFKDDLDINKKLIDTKIQFDLSIGDIVIFHSKVLHSAYANSSQNPKISFVYTVRAKNNLPIKGTRSSKFAEIEL